LTQVDSTIKHFTTTIKSVLQKAREFVSASHFHPNLTLADKVGAYPKRDSYETPL